jgi:hypothetical protein
MGKIFALGLLLMISAAVLGLDFTRASKTHPAGAYSLSDHLAFRTAALKSALPLPRAAAEVLPSAPDGWIRHGAVYEDTVRATGKETPATEIVAGKQLEKTIYDALPGYKRYYQTYEKDGQIVVIDVNFIPATEPTQKGRAAMGMLFRRMASGAEPWATIKGVDLSVIERAELGHARIYLGQIDGFVYISAASNADDATTKLLLSGVDFDALREMIEETKAMADAAADPARPATDSIGAAGDCVRKGAGKFCSVVN